MRQASDDVGATLIDLLVDHSAIRDDKTVFTYLTDGDQREEPITRSQLHQRARALAARLQEQGAQGERVLLVLLPGPDFIHGFLACLYAGAIAVPCYPPFPHRIEQSSKKLTAILTDCDAKYLLASEIAIGMKSRLVDADPILGRPTWLSVEDVPSGIGADWRRPGVRDSEIAYLQYTSGSTGTPKGVCVTHRTLLDNASFISHGLGSEPLEGVGVNWLPPYHDMGLVAGLLGPLYRDGWQIVLSPLHFLQRPLRWLEAISRYRGTMSAAPNFAYDMCVRKSSHEERAALDLSCWHWAYMAAEPVRPETMRSFSEAFGPSGFTPTSLRPGYGLAEATLVVTSCRGGTYPTIRHVKQRSLEHGLAEDVPAESPEAVAIVSAGFPIGDTRLVIVDSEKLMPCPDGTVGEIWIHSSSLAKGYWLNPEATREVFEAKLSNGDATHYLRTGDLGFLADGELYITGRIKDLIIIRGRNLYPQDLEAAVQESHSGFRAGCGVAFSITVEREEAIVIVQEVVEEPGESAMKLAHLALRAVSEGFDVATYDVQLVPSGSVPKTSSGKLQRRLTRDRYLEGSLTSAALA